MPTGGVMVVLALAAIGFVYGAKPIVKAVKKVDHGVCHIVTLGKKCQPKRSK